MPFVLDPSVAACWAFEDENHPIASTALARLRIDAAIAPGLLWFELRNTLVVNEWRGRVTPEGTASFLREFSRLGVKVDRDPAEASVMTLVRRYRLTVYDAAYLELAQRAALPLATLDTGLTNAARAENVPTLNG